MTTILLQSLPLSDDRNIEDFLKNLSEDNMFPFWVITVLKYLQNLNFCLILQQEISFP